MRTPLPMVIALILACVLANPAGAQETTLQFKGVDGINLEMELKGDSSDTRIGTMTHERFGDLVLWTAGKGADGEPQFVIRRTGAPKGAKGVKVTLAAPHLPGGTVVSVLLRDKQDLTKVAD